MKLRRYDTYIVHYDNDAFIEEEEHINGEHTNANDALNIITVQKNRIAELEIRALKLGHNCLTLQYELDMEHGLRVEAEARIKELESVLCEDSRIGYWIEKAKRYEKALIAVAENTFCQCEPAYPEDGEGPFICSICIAKRELIGGE